MRLQVVEADTPLKANLLNSRFDLFSHFLFSVYIKKIFNEPSFNIILGKQFRGGQAILQLGVWGRCKPSPESGENFKTAKNAF